MNLNDCAVLYSKQLCLVDYFVLSYRFVNKHYLIKKKKTSKSKKLFTYLSELRGLGKMADAGVGG